MTAFERMKLREQAAGSTPREEMIYYAKDMIDTLLPNDPSYKPNTKVIRNGEVAGTIGIRMDNRKLVNEIPVMEIHDVLQSRIKFRRGDILQVEITEEGVSKDDFWLCFEENNFHDIQRDGKVELCNFPLRWQDDDDFSIIEEWCVVSRYKTSSTGEDSNKIITVDNTRRNILIQYNERTAKLVQGKRFFIDIYGLKNIKPYKLTDLDRTSYIYNGVGCFQLVCAEEQRIGDKDRLDLGVCDYIEPSSPLLPSIGLCEITYKGQPIIKSGGSTKVFTAVFKDSNNDPINIINPSWEIIPSDLVSSNEIVILSQEGNEISVKANDSAQVGTVFVLKLSVNDPVFGFFESSIEVEVGEIY